MSRTLVAALTLVLCPVVLGASVAVRTAEELREALAKDDPPWSQILLASPQFEFAGGPSLEICNSSTERALVIAISPQQTGDVVIVPPFGRHVVIWSKAGRGCDVTISGRKNADGTIQRIRFTGDFTGALVEVAAPFEGTGTTKVRFDYVDFYGNASGNGNGVAANPVEHVDVTCNRCRAYDNANDGWTLPYSSSHAKYITLRLNDCRAYHQFPEQIPNYAAGDGVTNHTDYGRVLITGGTFSENGKAGVSHVAGYLRVVGATFYRNGLINPGNGDIYVGCTPSQTKCYAVIDSCIFYGLNNAGAGQRHITAAKTDYLEIANCVFSAQQQGNTGPAIAASDQTRNLVVRNNTFHDQYNCIEYHAQAAVFNNIFSEVDAKAISSRKGDYRLTEGNGYNCFHNVAGQLSLAPTDIVAEPRFLAPDNGDFRLRADSPCLNAGRPLPAGGFGDIGACQGWSVFRDLPPNCRRPLRMDLNDDCRVDSRDLAIMGARWLECWLEPVEDCRR